MGTDVRAVSSTATGSKREDDTNARGDSRRGGWGRLPKARFSFRRWAPTSSSTRGWFVYQRKRQKQKRVKAEQQQKKIKRKDKRQWDTKRPWRAWARSVAAQSHQMGKESVGKKRWPWKRNQFPAKQEGKSQPSFVAAGPST